MHDPIKDGGNGFFEQNFSSVMKVMGALIALTALAVAILIGWMQFNPTL